jgi:hypothetical protein
MMVPFTPCPHQHLLLVVFLKIAILSGVKWNLSVVFDLHFLYGQGWCAFLHVFFKPF